MINFEELELVVIPASSRIQSTDAILKVTSTQNRFELTPFAMDKLEVVNNDNIVLVGFKGQTENERYYIGKDKTPSETGTKVTSDSFSYASYWQGIMLNDSMKVVADKKALELEGIMVEGKNGSTKTVTYTLSEESVVFPIQGVEHTMYALEKRTERDTQVRTSTTR